MASNFTEIALVARVIADAPDGLCRMTNLQRDDLREAARILDELDQLRRDLLATDSRDSAAQDDMAERLLALLGQKT